jgi:hypothetical protein
MDSASSAAEARTDVLFGQHTAGRKGRLEAIKRGRIWYTTRHAVAAYRQSVSVDKG